MDKSLSYGIGMGLLSSAYVFLLYMSNPVMLIGGWENFNWLFYTLGLLLLGKHLRNPKSEPSYYTIDLLKKETPKLGAYINMPVLLRALFRAFVFAYTLKFLFVYWLFRYYDSDLVELVKAAQIKTLVENRPSQMTDAIFEAQLEAFAQNDFAPDFEFLPLLIMYIVGFALSLFIALFFRRPRPEYLEEQSN